MTILYSSADFVLRCAAPADCARLARSLRYADKRELRTSHKGLSPRACLQMFLDNSAVCVAVMLRGRLGALCGVVPAGNKKHTACVWLLTARVVNKYPKAFYKASQKCLSLFWARYPLLFNFADERYSAAFRLVAHLGGQTHRAYVRFGATRFLLVTLRRKTMGGVITQQAKTALSGVSGSVRSSRARAREYERMAREQAAAADYAQARGEEEMNYLFESAAEKTRRLYAQAREQAAAARAAFAGGGVTGASATLDTLLNQNRLQTQLNQAYLQDKLQQELGTKEQLLIEQVRNLREKSAYYYGLSTKKSTLSKLGDAFLSLWK